MSFKVQCADSLISQCVVESLPNLNNLQPNIRNVIQVVGGPTTLNLTVEQSGSSVLCQTSGGDITITLPLSAPAGTWYHINRDTSMNIITVDSQGVGIGGREVTTPLVPFFSLTVNSTVGAPGDNISVISNGILWFVRGVSSGFVP